MNCVMNPCSPWTYLQYVYCKFWCLESYIKVGDLDGLLLVIVVCLPSTARIGLKKVALKPSCWFLLIGTDCPWVYEMHRTWGTFRQSCSRVAPSKTICLLILLKCFLPFLRWHSMVCMCVARRFGSDALPILTRFGIVFVVFDGLLIFNHLMKLRSGRFHHNLFNFGGTLVEEASAIVWKVYLDLIRFVPQHF